MADWKQITARIRRARTSKDPAGQLTSLFEKTRDAMVAFELARYLEVSGKAPDAANWYATAAERFRRADWKTKAQDAAARLGGGVPVQMEAAKPSETASSATLSVTVPEPGLPFEQNAETFELVSTKSVSSPAVSATPTGPEVIAGDAKKSHRRGRRGGRNRRRGGADKAGTPSSPVAATTKEPVSRSEEVQEIRPPRETSSRATSRPPAQTPAQTNVASEFSATGMRGRSGDPGLSSRLTLLEMQMRRLLTCPAAKLEEASHAPAGPGVFVLTDDEMTIYYYVEACDTLRVAIANVARGGANRRGAPSIKPLLAEHLGIPETRVSKYLSDHCVVRWLQLDEGSSHFAHFVTAVLKPVLNE